MTRPPVLPQASKIPELAQEVSRAGGRLVVVGGWVRDQLRGEDSKDLDAEIFGLSLEAADELLLRFDSIGRVGHHFPVWRLRHQNLDLAYPRDGALEYDTRDSESLERAYRKAARHRDLTLNAIAWDPLDQTLLDPFNGIADLEAKTLRAVDEETFGSDPLRGVRVARLRAQLGAEVEASTLDLCRALRLERVAVERLTRELRRILCEPEEPSRALEFLHRSGLLRIYPPVAALVDVPQDPRWHPEGDVFTHTCMVVDVARSIGAELDPEAAEILQWSSLCHDLGKPSTTTIDAGRIRSLGHERVGATIAAKWLAKLRVAERINSAVETLVANHLAPASLVDQKSGLRAYRRLARKLDAGGVDAAALERLARADHLGRTTSDARIGRFDAGTRFLERSREAGVAEGVPPDLVDAHQLIARGFRPGPALGAALARARALQDETGAADVEAIVSKICLEFRDELDATRDDVEG